MAWQDCVRHLQLLFGKSKLAEFSASRLLATEDTGGEWPWQGGDLEAGAEEVEQSKTLF